MAGTSYYGYGAGPGGSGQAIDVNGYGHGVGIEGSEAQHGPISANSASFHPFYGNEDGQHQPHTHQQGPYGPPWVQQYHLQSAAYPRASAGYGSPPEWQPGRQKHGYYGDGGSGAFVQGGPAVETRQGSATRRVWGGGGRTEIFEQEDCAPNINVHQIPRPFGPSKNTNTRKKFKKSRNRHDSKQNNRFEDEIVRYGMGSGGSRTENFSEEDPYRMTNVQEISQSS